MSNHNVLNFVGALDPRRAIRFAKPTEADADAIVIENRERADARVDPFLEFERREYRQSVIPLKPSLTARLVGWVRGLSTFGVRS